MTATRTFPFPITNAEDKRRLELIRDAGEWRGWKIKQIEPWEAARDCYGVDIIVYDHEADTPDDWRSEMIYWGV
jgi:hypothetical protein